MTKTLVISVEFSDDDDFDTFRHRFVDAAEEKADEIKDKGSAPWADGEISVSWDVEEGDSASIQWEDGEK